MALFRVYHAYFNAFHLFLYAGPDQDRKYAVIAEYVLPYEGGEGWQRTEVGAV